MALITGSTRVGCKRIWAEKNAMCPIEDVLSGTLVPALLEDNGPTGQFFAAQDFRYLKRD
jgi:hypothetical protein